MLAYLCFSLYPLRVLAQDASDEPADPEFEAMTERILKKCEEAKKVLSVTYCIYSVRVSQRVSLKQKWAMMQSEQNRFTTTTQDGTSIVITQGTALCRQCATQSLTYAQGKIQTLVLTTAWMMWKVRKCWHSYDISANTHD
jgi:hypothetical protein